MTTAKVTKPGPQLIPSNLQSSKASGSSTLGKTADVSSGAGATQDLTNNFGVDISPKAKERAQAMQKAFDIAKNTPDVREDKVKKLKEQIANGTYQVDSGNIADGMLREAIRDHLAENPNLT